jgi:hypothetical protein
MAYADFQTQVTDLLRDNETKITNVQRDAAIDSAVIRYSSDRPYSKVVDAMPAANVLALPVSWEVGFSDLISIEYPIGSNPPIYLESEIYRLYSKPDGTQEIRFDNSMPAANVRLTFTVKHSVIAGGQPADTVPIADREAVCKYAASLLCDQLAALYSNTQDSTIQADAVQYQSKASQRRSQAKTYRQQYLDYMGVDEKNATPAGVSVAIQLKDSFGGQRIFHGRNRRLH